MAETLNEITEEITVGGILTDKTLKFFRDIDVMMSNGMMVWLVETCKSMDRKLRGGGKITYDGKSLTQESLKALLNDNLSDYLMNRIYG